MSTTSQTSPIDPHPVSISSRFNLDSWDMQDADVLFLTPDEVFFYAHRSLLLQYSSNSFGGLLVDEAACDSEEEIDVSQPMSGSDSLSILEPRLTIVNVPSEILNVVLLALYQYPIHEFAPSNETLLAVIPTLASLGYKPNVIAYPRSELYILLLKAAAVDPLPVYAMAAQYSFDSLAVAASALTLRTPLYEVTEELSRQMGPVYLRRLFFLHLGRSDALRRILESPPALHPPESDSECNSEAQKAIQRAWILTSAYIIAQNHPGEVNDMTSLLGTRVECTQCRRSLQERVARLVHDWSAVKYTI